MKLKINLWSFIFSFICVALFFISVSSRETVETLTKLLHTHPLNVVLAISFITFIFGLIGFSESTNWKLRLRSISTVVITLCLCIVVIFITVMANMFKFT